MLFFLNTLIALLVLGWLINLVKLLRRSDVPKAFDLDRSNAQECDDETDKSESSAKKLSILIPARNESVNIENALTSALAVEWIGEVEIIVIDDRSTDSTAEIIERVMQTEPRVKLVSGQEPPEGWLGKPHALFLGQKHASGDVLLFVDADVSITPSGVKSVWRKMVIDGVGVASVLGRLETASFFEHIIQPRLGAILLGGNPLDKVNDLDSERVLANGQFLIFTRNAYEQIGGHESIKDSVLDDIDLATKAKGSTSGYRLYFGNQIFRCRMYHGLSEIWSGWSKNLFPAMQYNLSSTLVVVSLISLWTWIPFMGLFLLATPLGDHLPLHTHVMMYALTSLILLTDALGHARNAYNWKYFWSFPIGLFIISLLFLNSAFQIRFGKGAQWKGRAVETPAQRRRKEIRQRELLNTEQNTHHS